MSRPLTLPCAHVDVMRASSREVQRQFPSHVALGGHQGVDSVFLLSPSGLQKQDQWLRTCSLRAPVVDRRVRRAPDRGQMTEARRWNWSMGLHM